MKNNYANKQAIAAIMDMAKYYINKPGHEIAMRSSAELCYLDACEIMGDIWTSQSKPIDIVAAKSALKSLAYSIGVYHADYQAALKIYEKLQAA